MPLIVFLILFFHFLHMGFPLYSFAPLIVQSMLHRHVPLLRVLVLHMIRCTKEICNNVSWLVSTVLFTPLLVLLMLRKHIREGSCGYYKGRPVVAAKNA